ncbi:unnamed protein product, partial [Vitis vinifera]
MSFTLDAAEKFGVPEVVFWTTSACGFLGYRQYRDLLQRGLIPLKDESCLTNGYLDTIVDSTPGIMKTIRLRDFPAIFRTTDPNDIMLNFIMVEAERASKASAIILNTFDALEKDVLDALRANLPPVYTIGPLQHLVHQISDDGLTNLGSSLWKEQPECLQWLDSKEPNSVVYVNFGSMIVMTPQHLTELAWGLANSNKPFLWIIRPDLHPAVGGFVTHCGWNSTSESICGGRDKVEKLVRELMDGEKGKKMKKKAMEWKKLAEEAIMLGGSSYNNFNKLLSDHNHKRLLRSKGPNYLDGFPDFRFETIPDGLPPSDADITQPTASVCESTSKNSLAPFCNLISKLNDPSSSAGPPVTCIVSDGVMSFTLDAAEKFGVPEVLFWTTSACGFLGYRHYRDLLQRGLIPLKDESCLTNGYLDTIVDSIPGMMKTIRLRDFPAFFKTTDPNDIMLNFLIAEAERANKASAIILNTFDALEKDVLDALRATLPPFVERTTGMSPMARFQRTQLSSA